MELCKLVLNPTGDHLLIQFLCRHGITRTHNLSLMDSETLQAVYSEESCSNSLSAQPRLLMDTVVHFPNTQEEVTLQVDGKKVLLRNYTEPNSDPRRTMLTELSILPQEFDRFNVDSPSEITFCLKELRGLLTFAEVSRLPINIHFAGPGSPIIFTIRESVLEVTFLLATLSENRTRSEKSWKTAENSSFPDVSRTDLDVSLEMELDSVLREGWNPRPTHTEQPPARPSSPLAPPHEGNLPGEAGSEPEGEEAAIPSSPPQKKFRSLFFGSTLRPVPSPSPQHQVLARDSDEDP